jgi:hypothetical protein
MLVNPLFSSICQRRARQHPGEPVIESPSGMMRTGAVCTDSAVVTTAGFPLMAAMAVTNAATTARTADLLNMRQALTLPRGHVNERAPWMPYG